MSTTWLNPLTRTVMGMNGIRWGTSLTPVVGGLNGWPVALPLTSLVRQPQKPRKPYTPPASVPVTLMAHGAAVVQPVVTSWPGFAKGHFNPATQHLVGSIGGTTFPIQTDGETYPDGTNLWTARCTFKLPATLAADTITSVTVTPTAGASVRTPWITVAAIVAATDIRIRSYGGDCGALTYETSLNQIVANRTQTNYGVNPLGGWDILASGPIEVQIRAWSYRRDVASGAYHGWVRDTIYLAAYADGTYDVSGRSDQPNWDVPQVGATLGGAINNQHKTCCAIELYNGATRLGAWGGPNDPRTQIIPATAFGPPQAGRTAGMLTIPADYNLYQCVTFAPSAGGTLPSGITAGFQYWLGSDNFVFGAIYTKSSDIENSVGPVLFGTAGAGNIVMTPLAGTFPCSVGGGVALATPQGLPIRIGVVQAPVTIAWDERYESSGAQLWPSYSQTMTRYTRPIAADRYFPNMMTWGPWLNTTGDNPGDNRIGFVNNDSCMALLLPHDLSWVQTSRVQALSWADQPIWFTDPASGRLIVTDNGPDDAGSTYPNLGRSRPGTSTNKGGGAIYCDGLAGSLGSAPEDYRGYRDGYSAAAMESSHMPCPWAVPAHQSGHFMFSDQGPGHAMGATMQAGPYRHVLINGHTYYNTIMANQPRGAGWLLRVFIYAEAFTPSVFPEAAPVQHSITATCTYAKALAASWPDGADIGRISPWASGDGTAWQHYQCWIWATAVGFDQWRAVRDWGGYIEVLATTVCTAFNDASPYGGSGYLSPVSGYIQYPLNANGTSKYHSIREMIRLSGEFGSTPPPWPSTGLATGGVDYTTSLQGFPFSSTDFGRLSESAMTFMADAGVVSTSADDTAAVLLSVNTRYNTPPCMGVAFSSAAGWHGSYPPFVPSTYPVWAFVRANP